MASIARKAQRQKLYFNDQRKNRRRLHRSAKKNRSRPQRPAPLPSRLTRVVGALFGFFAAAFTRPTGQRFVVLLLAAILTTGNRTVSNLLRTVDRLAPGAACSYHRVMSKRCWSLWRLGRALANFIFARWLPEGPIPLAGDDTVAEHKGKKVFGKGCHRDAVRSTHSFTAFRWGHKWVVLAVLVQFPFAIRPWALPILCVLYRTEKDNKACGRRHKTPAELMRQMLTVLLRWFPQRRFLFVGDTGFGTHPLASFAHRHHQRLVLVSGFYADANLYAPPPKRKKGAGRPRVKGHKLPKPEAVVSRAKRQRLHVSWYGGGQRNIEIVTQASHWYKAGAGLVPVRWVYVHDCTGTHRDQYFFSTDVNFSAKEIVEAYTRRWNIETTFQEMRAWLKLEKTRGWQEKTVLRTAPCLFGLYAVIAVIYAELPTKWQAERVMVGAKKPYVTFSDAITAVRRWLWDEWIFAMPSHNGAFTKMPPRLRAALLASLAPSA
jgi:DDE superfamily endonuclease